ncbi:helix-turn-helix transcriptional regulator [Dyadobacter sp. CY312]|uniref:helix-turn-helix domain-containing protein n=1 Tax=Dyadobacter sp. CY312 TaxID=2907303 RepID=UPI001F2474E8|nr:helix-turn-helix transcriptional regulator [Dyadobacter sp. CY312]MCE7039290.1 helix-turn-helix domain-containing protein [Dyadobacter sp. CY312]
MTSAEKLQKALDDAGLTVTEFARKGNFTREAVRLWLSGGGIREKSLYIVAKVLDLDPEELRDDDDEPEVDTLGKRLKKLRLSQSLTQQDLAVASGISMTLISRVENGNLLSLSNESINSLSRYFDVPTSHFTDLMPRKKGALVSSETKASSVKNKTSYLSDLEKVIAWKKQGVISEKEFQELKLKIIQDL